MGLIRMNLILRVTAGVVVLFIGLLSPASATISDDEVVQRFNDYFNRLTYLEGDFVQIAPNGTRLSGRFNLRRPGRLRFAYAEDKAPLIIVDGFWLGVIDTKAGRVDRYPLSATPLRNLLKKTIDLAADTHIERVDVKESRATIIFTDRDRDSGVLITLQLDYPDMMLRRWGVVDPQGFETQMLFFNLREDIPVDPDLFFIDDDLANPDHQR